MIISFSETKERYYKEIKAGKVVIISPLVVDEFPYFYIKRRGFVEVLSSDRIRIDNTYVWNWVKFIYHTKIV